LRELAALFLRLGLTAFGGPAAHIALMEDEVVARRRWLSRFLKVGSVLFGSGYVLLAFLRADLVERWHRLTEAQLLDAVAVGQVTPGPVFTTATFLGYVPDGPRGGVVAALGIFLPTFFFVAISGPLVPRLRRSAVAGDVLDGVNVGSLALMAMVRGIHRAQSSRPAWCSWRTRKPSPSYLRGCELRRPVRSRGR
jgi:chromate transport protein ChrA